MIRSFLMMIRAASPYFQRVHDVSAVAQAIPPQKKVLANVSCGVHHDVHVPDFAVAIVTRGRGV